MRTRVLQIFLLMSLSASAVVIDRISIMVENSIVKQSDIERNIRVTSFLNGESPDFTSASRKKAADRLIDQIFIRRETEVGGYPSATLQEADRQLAKVKQERFQSDAVYQRTLRNYGIGELDLRWEFAWQLTILRFIEVRFKPATVVSDEDVQKYFDAHVRELRRANRRKSTIDDFRQQIEDILLGEKVNQEFSAWLDERRKDAKIQIREESLR
jgi:hypothetical protein